MKFQQRQILREASEALLLADPTPEELELTTELNYLTDSALYYAKWCGMPWQQAVKKAFRHNNHLAQVQEARHAKRAASRTAHPSHVESSK